MRGWDSAMHIRRDASATCLRGNLHQYLTWQGVLHNGQVCTNRSPKMGIVSSERDAFAFGYRHDPSLPPQPPSSMSITLQNYRSTFVQVTAHAWQPRGARIAVGH